MALADSESRPTPGQGEAKEPGRKLSALAATVHL